MSVFNPQLARDFSLSIGAALSHIRESNLNENYSEEDAQCVDDVGFYNFLTDQTMLSFDADLLIDPAAAPALAPHTDYAATWTQGATGSYSGTVRMLTRSRNGSFKGLARYRVSFKFRGAIVGDAAFPS